MARNKIKRGEDWIDYDLLSNDVNAKWSDYTTDYDFGKEFDFDLMNKYRDQILKGLMDGYIIYNPTTSTDSKYLYSLTKNIPEFNPKSKEAIYAAGLIGLYLSGAKAIEEEPWNASDYFGKIIKDTYFKGQEPNFEYLAKLTLDLKKQPYLEFMKGLLTGIENIPEKYRPDYTEFFSRSKGYMNDGEITPEELADLARYTGNGQYWEWLTKPEIAKVIKEDNVKDEKKPKIEDKKDKEIRYTDYYTFKKVATTDLLNLIAIVNLLNDTLVDEQLTIALKNPEKNNDLIMALLTKKLRTTKSKDGLYDLTNEIKFNSKTNKLIKSNNNFGVYENVNVETPEVKPKKEENA